MLGPFAEYVELHALKGLYVKFVWEITDKCHETFQYLHYVLLEVSCEYIE